jgi:hypothetical protein
MQGWRHEPGNAGTSRPALNIHGEDVFQAASIQLTFD